VGHAVSLIKIAVTRPHQLQWWQWGQILGIVLPFLLLLTGVKHTLLWALAVHVLMDFTLQSNETAAGKARREWTVLGYHALLSGGYTGLIIAGLPGLVVSATFHLLVDASNKFGLTGVVGAVVDQAAHIATLIVIWWFLS
jgi:hypothetical protein